MCFHILGFDVLITENFEPLLLEVNHTPSFTTDTPLDTFIKHKLIKDTLTIMNINSKTKTSLFNKAKQYNSERLLTGKRQIYQGEVKQR
jgi:tubulin polyglutamylase TTLL6/13